MSTRVGYIPYLNMIPFQQGFGPSPIEIRGQQFEFKTVSPKELGREATIGAIDAGALSMADLIRLTPHFEPLGEFGIGVYQPANSVLFFSKRPLSEFEGFCAVTDETSTSFKLLQLLLDVRYYRRGVAYGRIAGNSLFDGEAEGLLLIGDEALRARSEGVRGLPFVADLGQEWFDWQSLPFVFARWAVRASLPQEVKDIIETSIEKSFLSVNFNKASLSKAEGEKRGMDPSLVASYWDGFSYRLGAQHLESIRLFTELVEKQCLIA